LPSRCQCNAAREHGGSREQELASDGRVRSHQGRFFDRA
jgi:hypothetical protein